MTTVTAGVLGSHGREHHRVSRRTPDTRDRVGGLCLRGWDEEPAGLSFVVYNTQSNTTRYKALAGQRPFARIRVKSRVTVTEPRASRSLTGFGLSLRVGVFSLAIVHLHPQHSPSWSPVLQTAGMVRVLVTSDASCPGCASRWGLTTRVSPEYKSKGGLKQDELRRRREEQQVEIRRQKREENISKKRNFLPSTGPDSDDESGVGSWESPVRLITLKPIPLLVLTVVHSSRRT